MIMKASHVEMRTGNQYLMIDKNDLKKRESEAIFQTYGRQDVVLVRGSGVHGLGLRRQRVPGLRGRHCREQRGPLPSCASSRPYRKQADILIHTSNLYYTENQVLLAEELKRAHRHEEGILLQLRRGERGGCPQADPPGHRQIKDRSSRTLLSTAALWEPWALPTKPSTASRSGP